MITYAWTLCCRCEFLFLIVYVSLLDCFSLFLSFVLLFFFFVQLLGFGLCFILFLLLFSIDFIHICFFFDVFCMYKTMFAALGIYVYLICILFVFYCIRLYLRFVFYVKIVCIYCLFRFAMVFFCVCLFVFIDEVSLR